MAISSNSCTFLSIFLTLLCYLIFSCSASNLLSPSSVIASDQIKFWSENVQNKMPNSVLKKLSPMSKKDCDVYSNMISKTDKFTADANFCALAKLACFSAVDTYISSTTNTYNNNRFIHTPRTNEDPFSFFRLSILKKDNLIHLPNLKESMPDRAFLPFKISLQISLHSTDNILNIFSTPQTVPTKEAIETSVLYCNAEAIEGETKSCLKSLEEMIKFSKIALGGKRLTALSSKSTKGSNTELMIKNLKKIDAHKIVACHEVFLPFATYFCHSLSSTYLYEVEFVEPKSRAMVNTLFAMCHMDTSPWPANHVAFQILKFHPGQGEACHWFTQLDLAWIAEGESK